MPFDDVAAHTTEPTHPIPRLGAQVMWDVYSGMSEAKTDHITEEDINQLSIEKYAPTEQQMIAINNLWSVVTELMPQEPFYFSSEIKNVAKVQLDDALDWDFSIMAPPVRRTRKIKITLLRTGRGKPTLNLSADEF